MRILNYILVVTFFLMLTGCDDYLEIVPKGKKIPESLDDFKGFLENSDISYSTEDFQAAGDTRWYPEDSWVTTDILPVFKANFLGDEDYDRASKTQSSGLYSNCYMRIAHATMVINEVPELNDNSTELQRKEVIAQARMLRAFNYFYLVNVFARQYDPATAADDNGIVIQEDINFEAPYPQKSVAEVYKYILNDIELALPDLTQKGNNPFVASKAFGWGLKSKVHLFKKEFDEALICAEESLKLNSSIYDLNKYLDGELANYEIKENLFFAYDRFRYPNSDPFYSRISPQAVQLYGPEDIRFTGFFTTDSYFPTGSAAYSPEGAGKFSINDGGMRTTEIYLIKAELLARKGEIEPAMEIVNLIRRNRFPEGNTSYKLTASNKIEAMNQIMNERFRELILSVNRVWDIRRLASEPEYAITVVKDLTDLLGESEGNVTIQPNSPIYIMPFPLDVIDLHGGIKQNTK